MIAGLDTETTGVDFAHGAKPFLVTMCSESGNQIWYEWEVCPLTREPQIPDGDLDEIRDYLASADRLILQNPKFDAAALASIGIDDFPWEKVDDTLIAGHLLASNQPHDLTSMVLRYLSTDIYPLEEAMKTAVNQARAIAKRQFPTWMIAKEGLPCMPSAKSGSKKDKKGIASDSPWKMDCWLPLAIAKALNYPKGTCEVVNLRHSKFDVRIDRQSKWGNPYVIGVHGDRKEVIAKYRDWIVSQPALLNALSELDGKILGCHCAPLECHGDVLKELLESRVGHPWWKVTADYANTDSAVTVALFPVMQERLEARKLTAIYQQRMRVLPVASRMERGGVTINATRLETIQQEYETASAKAHRVCTGIADSYGYSLVLPKKGRNKSLDRFVWDVLKLEKVYPPKSKSKTGGPTLDAKNAMAHYLATLPRNTKGYLFIRNLCDKGTRDTAITYLKGYRKFWTPLEQGWYVLHPSLNPTGTDTLRWSSSNPNSQNISKKEGFNLRLPFGPAPGREWWSFDAKNIELRLPAYESGEAELIDLFERENEPPYYGSNHMLNFSTIYTDIWEAAVKEVGLDKAGPYCKKRYADSYYQWCKNGDFAVQYGAIDRADGKGTADRAFHKPGAHALLKERFGKLELLNQRCIAYANKYGYVETMPDKFVDPERGYPLLCTRNDYGKILETVPLNYRVQGTAMWWTMMAMIRVDEFFAELNRSNSFFRSIMGRYKTAAERAGGYHLTLQVHDELAVDMPKGEGSEPWKTNLPIAREIQKLMALGGEGVGVPTPVGCEYHAVSYSEGLSV